MAKSSASVTRVSRLTARDEGCVHERGFDKSNLGLSFSGRHGAVYITGQEGEYVLHAELQGAIVPGLAVEQVAVVLVECLLGDLEP